MSTGYTLETCPRSYSLTYSSPSSVPSLPPTSNPFIIISTLIQRQRRQLIHYIPPTQVWALGATKLLGRGATFEVRQWQSDIWRVQYVIKSPLRSPQRTHDSITQAVIRELRVLSHPPLHACGGVVLLYGVKWNESADPNFGPLPSLILEFAEFGNLDNLFRAGGELDERQAVWLAADIAAGLAALHDCAVIHGDIKAGNVLIFRKWRDDAEGYTAKLSDFGHTIFEMDVQDGWIDIQGTHPWIAPEYVGSVESRFLKQTDIYSYGHLFSRLLLAGYHPFLDSALRFDKAKSVWSEIVVSGAHTGEDDILNLAQNRIQSNFKSFPRYKEMINLILAATLKRQPQLRASSMNSIIGAFVHHGAVTSVKQQTEKHRVQTLESMEGFPDISDRPTHFLHDSTSLDNLNLFCRLSEVCSSDEAATHNPEASYQLALCHFYGIGTKKNADECVRNLTEAAIGGHRIARLSLQNVYEAFDKNLPATIRPDEWYIEEALRGKSCPGNAVAEIINEMSISISETEISEHSSMAFSNSSQLFYALDQGLTRESLSIISCQEFNPNMKNSYGETPLHVACRMGLSSVVTRLCELNTGFDADNRGVSPLHWLYRFEDNPNLGAIGDDLLSHGCGLEIRTDAVPPSGSNFHHIIVCKYLVQGTALSWATAHGCSRTISYLLQRGADPWLAALGAESGSPIVIAVLQQQTDILKDFLATPINYPNPHIPPERVLLGRLNQWVGGGETLESLLSLAIKCCQDTFLHIQRFGSSYRQREMDIIRTLIQCGANSMNVEECRQTALAHAVRFADLEIVRLIISLCGTSQLQICSGADHGFSPLQWAVFLGKPEIFDFLVQKGADIEEVGEEDQTLLHIWARAGREDFDIAQRILRLGIDIDRGDVAGDSALNTALVSGHLSLASFLTDLGANPNFVDRSNEYTVLGYLIATNALSCLQPIQFLLEKNGSQPRADFVVGQEKNVTALHIACMRSELKEDNLATKAVMQLLLETFDKPKHINAMRTDGFSALHLAAVWGNHVCATLLLEKGADVNAWSPEQRQTPLDMLFTARQGPLYSNEKSAYEKAQNRRFVWEVYRQEGAVNGIEFDEAKKGELRARFEEEDYLLKLGPEEKEKFVRRTEQMESLLLRHEALRYQELHVDDKSERKIDAEVLQTN